MEVRGISYLIEHWCQKRGEPISRMSVKAIHRQIGQEIEIRFVLSDREINNFSFDQLLPRQAGEDDGCSIVTALLKGIYIFSNVISTACSTLCQEIAVPYHYDFDKDWADRLDPTKDRSTLQSPSQIDEMLSRIKRTFKANFDNCGLELTLEFDPGMNTSPRCVEVVLESPYMLFGFRVMLVPETAANRYYSERELKFAIAFSLHLQLLKLQAFIDTVSRHFWKDQREIEVEILGERVRNWPALEDCVSEMKMAGPLYTIGYRPEKV